MQLPGVKELVISVDNADTGAGAADLKTKLDKLKQPSNYKAFELRNIQWNELPQAKTFLTVGVTQSYSPMSSPGDVGSGADSVGTVQTQ